MDTTQPPRLPRVLIDPPIVEAIRNVSHPGAWREFAAFFRSGRAARFKVYLDDACALPADWRADWDAPTQWGSLGNGNWATKYAAAGFIPHMIDQSPFVTKDWWEADASVVVVFPRHFAGGPTILQQQCLLRLQSRSPAFRATNGSRHFFIFVDSRGPCCAPLPRPVRPSPHPGDALPPQLGRPPRPQPRALACAWAPPASALARRPGRQVQGRGLPRAPRHRAARRASRAEAVVPAGHGPTARVLRRGEGHRHPHAQHPLPPHALRQAAAARAARRRRAAAAAALLRGLELRHAHEARAAAGGRPRPGGLCAARRAAGGVPRAHDERALLPGVRRLQPVDAAPHRGPLLRGQG